MKRLHVLAATAWLGTALFCCGASGQTVQMGHEHPDVVFDGPGSRPVRRTTRPDFTLDALSGRILTTPDNQILVELAPDDIVPANLFDLNGRTLVFTPDGQSGYSRSVLDLAWEEDLGGPVLDGEKIELDFRFEFSGREWESFFVSRRGLIAFSEPYPFSQHGPDRWGAMLEIAQHLGDPPMISALYKPRLGGWNTSDAEHFGNTQHISLWPDRVVITWITTDPAFHVHGLPPKEKTRFQMALHADGASRSTMHRNPKTPMKRSATASLACSPRSPRPACSGASQTRWTAPFPRTSICWKPPST